MEIIEQFAAQFKVKTRRDACGDTIIPGMQHRDADGQSDIFDGYDHGQLAVALLFGTRKKWGNARRKLEAAGFLVRQLGDTEGVLTFDAADEKQARVAIKASGIRIKRQMAPPSAAQLAHRQKFAARRREVAAAVA